MPNFTTNIKKNKFLLFFSFFFVCIFIVIQICLFEVVIPIISDGKFSHLGLLDGDSILYHEQILFLNNNLYYGFDSGYYGNYLKLLLDFTTIPLNIKILSFFYLINNNPISLIFLNLIYFIISLVCLFKLSKVFYSDNMASSYFYIIVSGLLLFLPSFMYSFNSSGKEAMCISFILIYTVLIINNFIEHHKIYLIKIIGFALMILILLTVRPHFAHIIFISTFFMMLISIYPMGKSFKIIINLLKLLLSFLIIYVIYFYFITDFLFQPNYSSVYKYINDQKIIGNSSYILTITYNSFVPDFIEQIYFKIYSLREHFIQHSLLSGSSNLVSSDLNLSDMNKFFFYIPKLLFQSIMVPYPFSISSNSNKLFLLLNSLETILIYLILLSLIFNYKNIKSYEFYFIIIIFFVCSLLLFVNPNIGTFIRVRLPFYFILIILGIKNWVNLIVAYYHNNKLNKTIN